MNSNERDISILKHIIKYCNDISETVDYFGSSYEIFCDNNIYKNAVSMCILQIGELSGSLSDKFKDKYKGIPWRSVKGMRNVMAHKYGSISASVV
jgi:uncharacterized protein with HEPN domain